MPKQPKKFEGEGNPAEGVPTGEFSVSLPEKLTIRVDPVFDGKSMLVTTAELEVLRKVLDRDRTSKVVHGGLKSLLVLTDAESEALLGFLRRA